MVRSLCLSFLLISMLCGLTYGQEAYGKSALITFGPPYYWYMGGYGPFGAFSTKEEAIDDYWKRNIVDAGWDVDGCYRVVESYDPYSDGGRVVTIELPRGCEYLDDYSPGVVIATDRGVDDVGKNLGDPCCNAVGNPINAGTGNKFQKETDVIINKWLKMERYYNSDLGAVSGHVGKHWRHTYDYSLSRLSGSGSDGAPADAVTIVRPDGKVILFTKVAGQWVPDQGVADSLSEEVDASGATVKWSYFSAESRWLEIYTPGGLLSQIVDESGLVTKLAYSDSSTAILDAPIAGLLLSVTDPAGRSIRFRYDSYRRIASVILPDGGGIKYNYITYDDSLNVDTLIKVVYQDGSSRGYSYNIGRHDYDNYLPAYLNSIVDEGGVEFAKFEYNQGGMAILSEHAGGASRYVLKYTNGVAKITYPSGLAVNDSFVVRHGRVLLGSVSAACNPACGRTWSSRQYDANGYPQIQMDFNGGITTTAYSAGGLLNQEISAAGTPDQRTTNTIWDATLRVPLNRKVLDAKGTTVANVTWVYNAIGQATVRCEIDPTMAVAMSYACSATGSAPAGVRRATTTYCSVVDAVQCPLVGLVLATTDPLGRVTQYSYYLADSATSRHGDLRSVTDALGHVTTNASYDGAGRVTRKIDANGVITDLTYTPRGWLSAEIVRALPSGEASSGDAITTIGYTPYGAVASITDPDGVVTTYTYDDAHRLTDITDAVGNRIHYTLDAAGNKTKEEIFDSTGTTHYSQSKTFNALGQLTTIVDGLNHTVFNASTSGDYDANGNLLHSADALGVQTQRSYDALNRLVSTIRDYNGTDASTKNSTTTVAYDALDRVTGVSDPNSLVTSYTYDGLGDLTHLQSPDTGLSGGSSGDVFDAAGNLTQHTDARGVVTQYTYDALNRLTAKTYPAHPALNVTYTYDQAAPIAGCSTNDNIGHLTTMTDASGSTSWCYTAQGDIGQVRQTINGVSYLQSFTYTPGRRLQTQAYPSGFTLSYSYDSDGRVATVGYYQQPGPYGSYTDSTVRPLITAVSYLPFGPMSSYSWAEGSQYVQRTYDLNYALTDIVGSALNLHFLRDAKGRMAAEGDTAGASPANESYQSDALDRLTQLTDASGTTEQAFSYNLTGDRLSKTVAGQTTSNYGYQSGTHQLTLVGNAPRTVDADGNTTSMLTPNGTQVQLVYDDRNLLTQVLSGGNPIADYQYNGRGIRVWRTITAPSTGQAATVYDPLDTGNLYGEYFAADYREYVYLNGIPVASAMDAGLQAPDISYLHADGLGSVRVATTTTGAVTDQWQWLDNAFGDRATTGSSGYYLRFPGQYYDAETGLRYNGHRYYDPSTGRYIQSDPIGLNGGESTYTYVRDHPLESKDPSGLQEDTVTAYCIRYGPEACAEVAADANTSSGASSNAAAVGGAALGVAAAGLSSDSGGQCPKDGCAALIAQIQDLTDLMETKYDEMLADQYDLYNRAFNKKLPGVQAVWGTWVGHVKRYDGLQTGLKRMIARADAKGCPVPPKARQMANTPSPHAPINSYD